MKLVPFLAAAAVALASFFPSAQAAPKSDHIVVLISVDGLAGFYFDDPKAEMPTLRRLAKEGARASGMKASLPTVTWPNHTTLVTGVPVAKHGVVGNSFLDRETAKVVPLIPDPLLNKEEIVKSPTIYDVAKEAGLKTAGIIWPGSRGAKTLDWTVPDVATNALWSQFGTPALLESAKAAGIPVEKQEEWFKGGQGKERDLMYTQLLTHTIRTYRPNVALLHLVELDHIEHAKGPRSPEAYEIIKFQDDRVREVWEELQRSFPGKATLIVASDHGFWPYQQQVQPNVVLRKEGLLEATNLKITGGSARAVGQGGASFIYITNPAQRDAILPRLAEAFRATEGVQWVLTPPQFSQYGLPDPAQQPRMADLVLSAKRGYTFSDSLGGDLVVTPKSEEVRGSHGFDPNDPEMYASFIACGAGIKPGVTLGEIDNTSVAPTMAAILGVPMPSATGPVLKEILAHEK